MGRAMSKADEVRTHGFGVGSLDGDAHEVAAVEGIDVPALLETRLTRDRVDALGSGLEGLALLEALALDGR